MNGYHYRLKKGLQIDGAQPQNQLFAACRRASAPCLLLILGGLAYYEHRVNTSDANQLTYATVEQKLEADLAGARQLLEQHHQHLAGARRSSEGNNAARRLDRRQAARRARHRARRGIGVRTTTSCTPASNPAARPTGTGSVRHAARPAAARQLSRIWMSRAEMQETLSSIRTQLLSKQGSPDQADPRRVGRASRCRCFILGDCSAPGSSPGSLSGPISALVKSADRIGEGDYTRPLAVVRQRRTRRSAVRARAHAAESERNHHHQELSRTPCSTV